MEYYHKVRMDQHDHSYHENLFPLALSKYHLIALYVGTGPSQYF